MLYLRMLQKSRLDGEKPWGTPKDNQSNRVKLKLHLIQPECDLRKKYG